MVCVCWIGSGKKLIVSEQAKRKPNVLKQQPDTLKNFGRIKKASAFCRAFWGDAAGLHSSESFLLICA